MSVQWIPACAGMTAGRDFQQDRPPPSRLRREGVTPRRLLVCRFSTPPLAVPGSSRIPQAGGPGKNREGLRSIAYSAGPNLLATSPDHSSLCLRNCQAKNVQGCSASVSVASVAAGSPRHRDNDGIKPPPHDRDWSVTERSESSLQPRVTPSTSWETRQAKQPSSAPAARSRQPPAGTG